MPPARPERLTPTEGGALSTCATYRVRCPPRGQRICHAGTDEPIAATRAARPTARSSVSMQPFDFINRANAEYIDQLYQQYQRDPRSVEEPWRAFFAGFDAGAARGATPGGTAGEPPHEPGLFTTGVYDLVHS